MVATIRNADSLSIARTLLTLAIPIAVGGASDLLMSFVDVAVIGHYSLSALAALSAGTALYTIAAQTIVALTVGYQIACAQNLGKSDTLSASKSLFAVFTIVLPFSIVCIALLLCSEPLLLHLTRSSHVASQAYVYLVARSPCLAILALSIPLRLTLDCSGRTIFGMRASLAANALNAVLACILVLGFQMGAVGAGWANTLASAVYLMVICIWFLRTTVVRPKGPLEVPILTRLWNLSAPEVLSSLVDYGATAIMFGLIATFGLVALAEARIAWLSLVVLFVVAQSFAIGLQILVGRSLASSSEENVRLLVNEGSLISLGIGVVAATMLAVFSADFTAMFGQRAKLPNIDMLIRLLALAMPAMIWATSRAGVLRALGLTRLTTTINLVAIAAVQVPTAFILAVSCKLDILGVFGGFVIYFVARAIASEIAVRARLGPLLATRALGPS